MSQDLRDALTSDAVGMTFATIAARYELSEEQFEELVDECGLVILGFVHPVRLIAHLTTRLAVTPAVAQAIAEDVNAAIFRPVRASLRAVYHLTADAAPLDAASRERGIATGRGLRSKTARRRQKKKEATRAAQEEVFKFRFE
jgi:hypothetical protein